MSIFLRKLHHLTSRRSDDLPGQKFVVIYGVDLEREMIYYHDPFDGASQESAWEVFNAAWHTTVDTGDPLQPTGHTGWGLTMSPK